MHDRSLFRARVAASIACVAVALGSGTNYGYSAWAPHFSDRLKLSATQTNLIGVTGNLGMYLCGLPIGILIDSRGSRPSIFAGALLMGTGYFGLHEAYDKSLKSIPLLCLLSFMTGLGGCMSFNAALKTSASNWPHHRGTATGFTLAGFGLSAFVFSMMSSLFFPGDTSSFLSLLSYGTAGLALTGLLFVRVVPAGHDEDGTERGETSGSIESRRLTQTLSDENKSRRSPQTHGLLVAPGRSTYDAPPQAEAAGGFDQDGIESLRSSEEEPLATHLDTTGAGSGRADLEMNSGRIHDEQFSETSSLLSRTASPSAVVNHHANLHASSKPDVRGLQLLRIPIFWQLWIILAILAGVGLMTINNIGHNSSALWQHYDSTVSDSFLLARQQMHVSVISVGSFLGRLLSGFGSDFLTRVSNVNRLWCLVIGGLVFSAAQAIAWYLENPHYLIFVSALSGLGYGFVFGVFPSITAERFGIHGLSQNWGLMSLSPIMSSWVFSMIYGSIYDHRSVDTPNKDGGMTCLKGLECYRPAYLVTFLACIFGVVFTLWVIWHQRRLRMGASKSHNP